MGSGIKV